MENLDMTADIIDVRDIMARVEELEEERDAFVIGAPDGEETPDPIGWARENEDDADELKQLTAFLEDDLKGNGGDEQWRGDWYPVTLIRDSYFETAMDEMVAECYEIPKDLPSFMTITLDYKALQMDLHVSRV